MNRLLGVLTSLAVLLSACGGTPLTPDPAAEATVLIPATTKIADADTRAALSAYDADSGALTFAQSTPALASLKAGDVLVSEPSDAAPDGYLRKVSAIRQDGEQVVLDTAQANLTDAISEGDLSTDFQLSGDDLLKTEGLPEGATLTATPATGLKPQAGVGDNYGFNLSFNHTFVPIQNANATGTIKIDGSVAFNVGYGVNLGIHGPRLIPPRLPGLDSFQASVGFAQNSHLNITGDFQGTVGDAVLVGTQYFKPKVFFIGPVPVVLVPKVELYLTAGGEVKAHVNFAASESITAQVGARWTKDNGWKDISGLGVTGDFPTPTFSGSLNPRVGVQSVASFKLYDVAGPEATLDGGVKLDVAYPRNPSWIVNAFLKGTLGFRVKLPILGTLASYSTTLFDISKELGRSGNTPPTLTLTGQPHTVNVGDPLNFRAFCTTAGPAFGNGEFYSAGDAEDGCPQVSATSDKDGALTPDYSFQSAGSRTITVIARDSQGATASLSFKLTVNNPPPTLKLNYTGDPHQGEEYLMSAAVADSNEPPNSNLCNFTTWTVDAPDNLGLSSNPGCEVKVKFGATGSRQVRVSTHDSYGAVASQTVTLNVLPPPVNPYPAIISANVFNREYKDYLHFGECSAAPVTVMDGSTLDLTLSRGYFCTPTGPTIYFSGVAVDNPQKEALTYDWKLIVTDSNGYLGKIPGQDVVINSSQAGQFDLHDIASTATQTTPCRVTLNVGVSDPGRTKTLTVWSGRCTYHTSSNVLK